MAALLNGLQRVQQEVEVCARAVGGEKGNLHAHLMRGLGGLAGRLNGLVRIPLHATLQHVLAAGNLCQDAVNTAALGQLDIVHHISRKAVDLCFQTAVTDLPNRVCVLLRDRGRTSLDAVDAGGVQHFGDGDLVLLAEHDTRLLLSVPQRRVQKLDLIGKVHLLCDLRRIVRRSNPPFILLSKTHCKLLL